MLIVGPTCSFTPDGPPCWGQLMLMVMLGQCQECRPAGPTSLASSPGLLILMCYLSRQSEMYTQAGRVWLGMDAHPKGGKEARRGEWLC